MGPGAVQVVVERAGGNNQFKFQRRVKMTVRNGTYSGRIRLRTPGPVPLHGEGGRHGPLAAGLRPRRPPHRGQRRSRPHLAP